MTDTTHAEWLDQTITGEEYVTDPDVLSLYADRLNLDPERGISQLVTAAEGIANQDWRDLADAVARSRVVLTQGGDRARPLRDEGVSCG